MRGVWIATVANIDWPSQPGLSAAEQQTEIRSMLTRLAEANINCVVVQIRPTADAFYPSAYEPWSHWLTGKQGKKPKPYYDPLQFIIEEAHRRCMEVHLWLNPYRVTNVENAVLSPEHLFFKNKKMFVKYAGRLYFDPGLDETRATLNTIVEDLVQRYDMDAIHFDDYFYPYPEAGKDFPDNETFRAFPRGFTNKADWRRNNVNLIIAQLYESIKKLKPWVEFGISPFGVWRNSSNDPRGSATQAGIQNYDDLYADILKWLREGTIDYVVPQLYWETGHKKADYQTLVRWWADNACGKNLYIGLYASGLQVNSAAAWKQPNEIARQMQINRAFEQIDGAVFFSAKPFLSNPQGLIDTLQTNFYRYPALNPVNRNIAPGEPSAEVQNPMILRNKTETVLTWDKVDEEGGCCVAYYVVYAFKGNKAGETNNPENIIAKTVDNALNLNNLQQQLKGRYTFVVTAVNRFRHESQPSVSITERI